MANAPLRSDTIEGHKIDLYVGENGLFWARYNERQFSDKSLDGLRAKLRNSIRRANVNLAIKAHMVGLYPESYRKLEYWKRRGIEEPCADATMPITLTGINQHTSEIMYIDESGGKKNKRPRQYRDEDGHSITFTRELTNAEAAQWSALMRAAWDSQRALDAFTEAIKIENVENYLREAIERAAENGASDEPTGDPRVDAAPPKGRKGTRGTKR